MYGNQQFFNNNSKLHHDVQYENMDENYTNEDNKNNLSNITTYLRGNDTKNGPLIEENNSEHFLEDTNNPEHFQKDTNNSEHFLEDANNHLHQNMTQKNIEPSDKMEAVNTHEDGMFFKNIKNQQLHSNDIGYKSNHVRPRYRAKLNSVNGKIRKKLTNLELLKHLDNVKEKILHDRLSSNQKDLNRFNTEKKGLLKPSNTLHHHFQLYNKSDLLMIQEMNSKFDEDKQNNYILDDYLYNLNHKDMEDKQINILGVPPKEYAKTVANSFIPHDQNPYNMKFFGKESRNINDII